MELSGKSTHLEMDKIAIISSENKDIDNLCFATKWRILLTMKGRRMIGKKRQEQGDMMKRRRQEKVGDVAW